MNLLKEFECWFTDSPSKAKLSWQWKMFLWQEAISAAPEVIYIYTKFWDPYMCWHFCILKVETFNIYIYTHTHNDSRCTILENPESTVDRQSCARISHLGSLHQRMYWQYWLIMCSVPQPVLLLPGSQRAWLWALGVKFLPSSPGIRTVFHVW